MRYPSLVCAYAATVLLFPAPALAESKSQAEDSKAVLVKSTWQLGDSKSAHATSTWKFEDTKSALVKPAWQLEYTRSAIAKSPRQAKDTRSAALKWEIGYLALSAIDTAQTISCLDRGKCKEGNPLFGKNPSATKLILAKVGGGLAHFALFKYVNDRDPKSALRLAQISCGIQGGVVLLNARFTFK